MLQRSKKQSVPQGCLSCGSFTRSESPDGIQPAFVVFPGPPQRGIKLLPTVGGEQSSRLRRDVGKAVEKEVVAMPGQGGGDARREAPESPQPEIVVVAGEDAGGRLRNFCEFEEKKCVFVADDDLTGRLGIEGGGGVGVWHRSSFQGRPHTILTRLPPRRCQREAPRIGGRRVW